MDNKSIILTIIVLFIIVCLSYICHLTGKSFYNNTNNKDDIYDISHMLLPDLYQSNYLHQILDFMALLPFIVFIFFRNDLLLEFLAFLPIIYLIRSIFNNVTILPKYSNCDDSEYDLSNIFRGHCYDKIFSGHFAITVLFSFILYNYNLFNLPTLILYNSFNILLILLTRSHYSIDLLVSFSITFLVYSFNLKLF